MLAEHKEEVQALLLQRKQAHEEENAAIRLAEEEQYGLRSPPLPGVLQSSREGRHPSTPLIKSPKMPPLGYFNVSSPKSPRSPMKRTF